MFGYIIYYCKENQFDLTIFTNFENDLGWFEYYNSTFDKYSYKFNYKNFNEFEKENVREQFDLIFVATDDDKKFMTEWINDKHMNNKCICVDHVRDIRAPKFLNRLGTRAFLNSDKKWALPCFPGLNIEDKINNLNDKKNKENIIISIIGGYNQYNYDRIKRLQSTKKIKLYIIARYAKNFYPPCDLGIEYQIYPNLNTFELFELLKKSDYILTDIVMTNLHYEGLSMSGSIPLAFSSLTPLIISKQNNAVYNFKNVIEFDLNSTDKICIDNYTVDYNELVEERKQMISMFSNYIDENIFKKDKIKIFVIHYKKLNERKEFMIHQFNRENITNYEFITIDRDELTENDKDKFQKNFSKPLIANFLSHLYVYKQIKNNEIDYNLILEDDAILCSNFSTVLHSYISQFSKDYDAVFIGNGCNISEHHIETSKIITNCNVYKYDGDNKCKCTDSYLISKKCASYIVNYFNVFETKIDIPIDWFLNKPLKDLNVYWCEPTLVKQGTIIGLFNSSIGNGMLLFNGFNPNILTCYKSPFKKIRVGKDFDGGYIICDIPNIKYDLLLGCGVDNDISFESQFCDKYIDTLCYLYDGSVSDIYLSNKNIKFIKKNINNFNDENNTNLHEIIDKYDNIFLKMDIEGNEISWIKSLNNEKLNKISQIVIEFHFPFEDYKKDVFDKLNKYFILIHFHANNCCGVRNHNGIIIPNVFECTYLNRKFFNNKYELNTDNIPSILDMKNIIEHDEIYIDYEPFVNN